MNLLDNMRGVWYIDVFDTTMICYLGIEFEVMHDQDPLISGRTRHARFRWQAVRNNRSTGPVFEHLRDTWSYLYTDRQGALKSSIADMRGAP